MDHRNHHSAGTPIDCSCVTCSGISENYEVVAMEDFIDVGNILGKIWVSLSGCPIVGVKFETVILIGGRRLLYTSAKTISDLFQEVALPRCCCGYI